MMDLSIAGRSIIDWIGQIRRLRIAILQLRRLDAHDGNG